MYKIELRLKVDYAEIEQLSREFAAVLVELNTKHPIPDEVEYTVLKTLRQVFTTTTNAFKRTQRTSRSKRSWRRRCVTTICIGERAH